jgi:hypothetical protein
MLPSHAKICALCGVMKESGLRAADDGYCPANTHMGASGHMWVSLQEYYDESLEDF